MCHVVGLALKIVTFSSPSKLVFFLVCVLKAVGHAFVFDPATRWQE